MRKKRTYTRRGSALRWLGALAVLMLALNLLGIYCVLPSQTLPEVLQEKGLTKTEIIHYEWGNDSPLDDELLLVSKNEEALVLTTAKFTLDQGWYAASSGIVILWDDPERYDSTWVARKSGGESEWVCLFGFVPDGEEPPTFAFGVTDQRGPYDGDGYYRTEEEYVMLNDRYLFLEEPVTVTPVPTIPVEGGMVYLEQYSCQYGQYDYEDCDVVALMYQNGEWDDAPRWTISSEG